MCHKTKGRIAQNHRWPILSLVFLGIFDNIRVYTYEVEVCYNMKSSKFRKWLVLFALIVLIQNGTVIVQSTGNAGEVGSEESVMPYSDFPEQDAPHS